MDVIQGILAQLEINSSIFYQFGIVVVVFLIAKPLFLNKLQFVLEQREEKTATLKDTAGDMAAKAEKLSGQYHASIKAAYQKANHLSNEKKQEALEKGVQVLKRAEAEVSLSASEARTRLEAETAQQKTKLFSEVGNLAKLLVKKVTGLST